MAMMQAENPKADMRFAFVGYRDHINGPKRIVVQDFTSSVNELHAFLHAVHVISNNDACEDIAGGLEVLFLRAIDFLIAASCSGEEYCLHSRIDRKLGERR